MRFVNDSKATNADAAARALGCYDHIYWIAGGLPKEGGIDSLGEFFPRIRHAYLIGQAAQAARDSRLLMEQTLSMERVVRQYVILDDSGLLVDYAKIRASFKRTTSELSLLPLDEAQLAALNRTIDWEQFLFELLGKPLGAAAERAQLVQGYANLSEMAKAVLNESNLLIGREVDRVRGLEIGRAHV